ncbi:MAG: PIG-L deacetylase family protein [Armatimonadota bacterium]
MKTTRIAMAVAAHPDDIEFTMSGTLMLLGNAGYELHYMNVANGCCGSTTMNKEETIAVRAREAASAADLIGAAFHPSQVDDLMLYYEDSLVRRLCAIVREVSPEILLLPSPQDYMEDHTNVSRLMVTAAFCRNMPNYETNPQVPAIDNQMCVYHAPPMGFCDQLRTPIIPDFFVDVSGVMDRKREMLSCHKSQKEWLDESQGHDNYLHLMDDIASQVGKLSGRFDYAEGWRRHLHLGYGPEDFDPLSDALPEHIAYTGDK